MLLRAMAVVRDISKAYVYDTVDEAVTKFIKEMNIELNLEVVRADSPKHILEEADITCAKLVYDKAVQAGIGTEVQL